MTIRMDNFSQKVEAAQLQLESLIQQTQQTTRQNTDPQSTDPQNTDLQNTESSEKPALLTIAIDELSGALEEVNVLSEELYEQHEQLRATQGTLNRERQQYFELFDLAPDGYLVTDAKAIIQHINSAAATLFNRPQSLLLGKPMAALIAQADSHVFYNLINRLQNEEVVQRIGLYLQPAQNLPVYAAFTISAVRDRHDRITGFRWLFRDLTQQRKVAAALAESETQYRAIVEDQSELICRSLADGRITFANQAFCQYFDHSTCSLMGKSLFDLILQADQENVMQQLAGLVITNPTVTLEHRVKSPGGQIRWQQWNHRALFDANDQFFQFQSAGRDITAWKQAEEALQQREIQIQAITEALPILIAYVNANQQLVYSNQSSNQFVEPWLQRPNQDMVGHYLWDVLGKELYQQARIPIEKALLGEKNSFEQEISLLGRDPIWLSATLIPHVSEQGENQGFFLMVADISLQKTVESDKDKFISIVSHELRTPLTAIHGAMQLLSNPTLNIPDQRAQELLTAAARNSKWLVSLVNDLLDVQQMKLGKMPFIPHRCEAMNLITSAIDTLQVIAQAHQVTLSTRSCHLQLWADGDRMVQVLTNLLSNAIKFSSPGDTVWITAKQIDHQRVLSLPPHIKFQVRDEGEGIPADQLQTVFGAFYQVDASDSRRKSGTGLGLAICQAIIDQHQGSIKIDSKVGQGTTVSVLLPILAQAVEPTS
jgi:PAS domain S-box-containing protein